MPIRTWYAVTGPDLALKSRTDIDKHRNHYKTPEAAAYSMRYARGPHCRVVKVTVEEVFGYSAELLVGASSPAEAQERELEQP